MKKQILSWARQDFCETLKRCLQEEKVFIGSTDTVLGLFASPTQKGFTLLRELKKRENKPFLMLISSTICIKDFVTTASLLQIERLSEKFWPGPLTIVSKARLNVPSYLKSQEGTIAFRMPKHEGIQRLLKEVPMLFSTSANLSGEPLATRLEMVDQAILDGVEYGILDDNKPETIIPSTIVACDEQGNLSLIREGAIPFTDILKINV